MKLCCPLAMRKEREKPNQVVMWNAKSSHLLCDFQRMCDIVCVCVRSLYVWVTGDYISYGSVY